MSHDAWNPTQYEKFKAERSLPFFDLLNTLQPSVSPHVMDLGCGTGALTVEAHRRLGAIHTTGLDASEEMLRSARVHGTSSLDFQHGDINAWSMPGTNAL